MIANPSYLVLLIRFVGELQNKKFAMELEPKNLKGFFGSSTIFKEFWVEI